MPAINAINKRSTVFSSIRLFNFLPMIPPQIPPATMKISIGQRMDGTVLVKSAAHKLHSWLKKMIYKLFAAAVFVSMLKK